MTGDCTSSYVQQPEEIAYPMTFSMLAHNPCARCHLLYNSEACCLVTYTSTFDLTSVARHRCRIQGSIWGHSELKVSAAQIFCLRARCSVETPFLIVRPQLPARPHCRCIRHHHFQFSRVQKQHTDDIRQCELVPVTATRLRMCWECKLWHHRRGLQSFTEADVAAQRDTFSHC